MHGARFGFSVSTTRNAHSISIPCAFACSAATRRCDVQSTKSISISLPIPASWPAGTGSLFVSEDIAVHSRILLNCSNISALYGPSKRVHGTADFSLSGDSQWCIFYFKSKY